jgi:hypothetical protein
MMKWFARLITILVVLTLFYLIPPLKAYAYLDPGTGSYIFQLIIAALLGGLFAVKLFWNKIKISLKNLLSKRGKLEKA